MKTPQSSQFLNANDKKFFIKNKLLNFIKYKIKCVYSSFIYLSNNLKKMQLKRSSILNVPINTYAEDFSFIVNGEEFKTSRLASDLLSSNISRIHKNDPTVDTFTIDTHYRGNFANILDLVNFKEVQLPEKEIPFISEVIELLGSESIDIIELIKPTKITIDNVFSLIQKHEKYEKFYSKLLQEEINFVSSHFFEICEKKMDEIQELSIETLTSILKSPQLQLKAEDQLLRVLNELYLNNQKCSILYENVYFRNVSSEAIKEFICIFDINDITTSTWMNITGRLSEDIKSNKLTQIDLPLKRYKDPPRRGTTFLATKGNTFSGILNYLLTKTSGKIEKEVNITSSSVYYNQENCLPRNVVLFNDQSNVFLSDNAPNSSICFDFKEHRVIPSNYTIKSSDPLRHNGDHPKCWIFEASNDNDNWETLDSQNDCKDLNGSNLVKTFAIKNNDPKEFRYIRLRSTGPSWSGDNYFGFDSFEIFGSMF